MVLKSLELTKVILFDINNFTCLDKIIGKPTDAASSTFKGNPSILSVRKRKRSLSASTSASSDLFSAPKKNTLSSSFFL